MLTDGFSSTNREIHSSEGGKGRPVHSDGEPPEQSVSRAQIASKRNEFKLSYVAL